MIATIVDLRYKMREILKALDRKEKVTIMHYGKQKGIIIPARASSGKKLTDHPFFGMLRTDAEVDEIMAKLRGERYRAF